MLEGLEISEIFFSHLYEPMRIDAETYRPLYLEIENTVLRKDYTTLGKITSKLKKGIFDIKSNTYTDSGIPFVRISNLRNMGIATNDIIFIPESENEKNKDTCLEKGDIILSKTAYPAASIVSIPVCNTSQDTVAVKLNENSEIESPYIVTFLNTRYGLLQMQRWFTGNIQMHLNLTDCKGIYIPKLNIRFQRTISNVFWLSFKIKEQTEDACHTAENILLKELGLKDFLPSRESINIKCFSESFGTSGRLDAEYYQPKFDELEELIKQNALYYKPLVDIRTDNFRGLQPIYVPDGTLDVINSKHILESTLDYENFEKTDITYWEDQKRAQVFKGDILTYTTGANIGRTQVYYLDKKALASNHVNILRLKEENPYYVGFVMNSRVGRMQTDKYSAGSAQAELYPKDIDEFLIPFLGKEKEDSIVAKVEESLTLKKQSEALLEIAKRGVEIAIEQDEETAKLWIEAKCAKLGVSLKDSSDARV